MRLLTDTADPVEVNSIQTLLETNGIPVFIGNEDTARNIGFMLPVGKLSVFVIYDEQFYDAQCLLKDENHEVRKKIDMDEFHRSMELIKPNAFNQLLKGTLVLSGIFALLFVVFVMVVYAF